MQNKGHKSGIKGIKQAGYMQQNAGYKLHKQNTYTGYSVQDIGY
jgi:hypothetical protein